MSDAIKRLKEERAKAWAANQELRARVTAEGFDPMKDSDATASYNRSNDEVGRLSGLIEDLERGAQLETEMRGNVNPGKGETRTDERDIEARYIEAFNARMRLRSGQALSAEHRSAIEEYRAAPNLSNTNGDGALIPVTTLQKLVEAQKAFGGLLNYADVLDTSTGNPINFPAADTTTEVGQLVVEGGSVGSPDSTAFTQKTLAAYAYNSKILQLSDELVQDNEFDLVNYVGKRLLVRIARSVAQAFVTGAGGGSAPQGLLTGTSNAAGLTGGVAANLWAPSYANLVDLQHSIDPAYRQQGNSVFLMNDLTLAQIRKIVDGQQRPLWEPSMQNGEPDRILNSPVVVDQGMPVPATVTKTIGYGDIKQAYLIRRIAGVRTDVFNELYRVNRLVGYMVTQRWDATVQNSGAFKTLVTGT